MPLTPIRAEQRNSGDTYIFSRVGAGRYCNSLIINASIISTAPTLTTWMPAAVGARSLRCSAIRSLGIRRRPATKRDALLAVHIMNVSVSAVTY